MSFLFLHHFSLYHFFSFWLSLFLRFFTLAILRFFTFAVSSFFTSHFRPFSQQFFHASEIQLITLFSFHLSTMPLSLRTFLVNLKTQLANNAVKYPLKFVTGNQSADMDSVVSALSYAYFQYHHDPNVTLIPLINIPKNDFQLRRDIVLLLLSHSISDDNLFFVEDFAKLTTKEPAATTEVILVDHCNIQGDLLTDALAQHRIKVTSIIDHHADENVFLDAHPRVIQLNGSCSSLVFNYWYDQFNNKSIFKNNEVVQLLLGPLLIDTSNMTLKVEENDVIAFKHYGELLELESNVSQFQLTDTTTDLNSFYSQLKKAKKDLDGFKFYDILRKDYKQFKFVNESKNTTASVGFSSLGKSFYWILTKYSEKEILDTFKSVVEDLKLDVLVITTSYTNKETSAYTREFGYFYQDSRFAQLAELAAPKLQLNSEIYKKATVNDKITSLAENVNFKVYNQGDITASRKQVVPVVKDVLETKL